jgi:ABC-type multidrug transport system ATPase subunit
VSKSFGSNLVLDRVSFAVTRGETLCLMSRSGVGKSVCLQILMGFLKPDSGRVIAAGEDITEYSEEHLERQYRLQPVGNFGCDYATGADFCDAFVTSTDSSYLLAFLLTANHEAAERCFVAALDQLSKPMPFSGVGHFVD